MVNLKTPQEIEIMAVGGQIAARVLTEVFSRVRNGVMTIELDLFIEKRIKDLGGVPSFKGFKNYSHSSCININDGIVHGVPNEYEIKDGDLVSIDLGVLYQGFHSDISWTVLVDAEKKFPERATFLEVGRNALTASINECRSGKRIGDVSAAMQARVEEAGFNVVRDLVGHGVGRSLHEPPQIPCYGKAGTGMVLQEGMTLAVEVIYAQGTHKLRVLEDGWTMATRDGKLSGLFETTAAVTARRPRILTPLQGM